MRLEEWNEALAEWFFPVDNPGPAYLSATSSELDRMNDELALGLAEPPADLQRALEDSTFGYVARQAERWERSGASTPPPWLSILAASVFVASEQADTGSAKFYAPFSVFIGLRNTMRHVEYEQSLYLWWRRLAKWLEVEQEGCRGFATWRSIPLSGSRSFIGHPYTQVMLRREDRKDIDAFLVDAGLLEAEPPSLSDRQAAGRHLVAAFRRWSAGRRGVSARLLSIVEGRSDAATDSLGYLLVDRLFDRSSENREHAARRIEVIPVFDDYDRELRLAVLAPGWVSKERPLDVAICASPLVDPGQPCFADLPVSSELFSDGFTLDGEHHELAFQARSSYPLAQRGWDLWCGVRSVERDEAVYVLAQPRSGDSLGLSRSTKEVTNLPSGWSLYGPGPLQGTGAAAGLMAKERRVVPRLRGGLLVGGSTYLVGGEPAIELPAFEGHAAVDGVLVPVDGEELPLAALGLAPGPHVVEALPFHFEVTTIVALRPPDAVPTLGRTRSGHVVPVAVGGEAGGGEHGLVDGEEADGVADGWGAVRGERFGTGSQELLAGVTKVPDPWHRGRLLLVPAVERVVLLGAPGEVHETAVSRASWSSNLGLPFAAIEPAALSTYPNMTRRIRFPRWVVWQTGEGYSVAAWWADGEASTAALDPSLWRTTIAAIGRSPLVGALDEQQGRSEAEVLAAWRDYHDTRVDG